MPPAVEVVNPGVVLVRLFVTAFAAVKNGSVVGVEVGVVASLTFVPVGVGVAAVVAAVIAAG